jgi:hypothetical protein
MQSMHINYIDPKMPLGRLQQTRGSVRGTEASHYMQSADDCGVVEIDGQELVVVMMPWSNSKTLHAWPSEDVGIAHPIVKEQTT